MHCHAGCSLSQILSSVGLTKKDLFNNKVEMFPSSIVASMSGFKIKKMYEIAEAQRENVQVKF